MSAGRTRRGFTLFELMVTFAVMGVIAATVFTAGRAFVARHDGLSADLLLTQVVLAEQEAAVALGGFTPAPSDLSPLPSQARVVAGASTTAGTVSLAVGSGGTLVVASVDQQRVCHYRVVPAPSSTAAASAGTASIGAACSAAAFLPAGEDALPATSLRS